MTSREQIYSAFYELVRKTPGFNATYRYSIAMDNANARPAMIVRQLRENVQRTSFGMPPKVTAGLEVILIIDTPTQPTDQVPATIINPLIDAVQAQIDGTFSSSGLPFGNQDLGIADVSRVYVNGEIMIDEAMGSNTTSVVSIPVTIVYE